VLRSLCWWRPPCLLRKVIVNFQHDATEAVEGVLWSSRGAWFTLRAVSALKANHQPTPIPGDVVIHRSNIAYMQVLP
jgi:hypothetical protein